MEEFYHTMHDNLIEQYMKEHPSATLEFAIEVTADEAWQCGVDRLANIADFARMRAKRDGVRRI